MHAVPRQLASVLARLLVTSCQDAQAPQAAQHQVCVAALSGSASAPCNTAAAVPVKGGEHRQARDCLELLGAQVPSEPEVGSLRAFSSLAAVHCLAGVAMSHSLLGAMPMMPAAGGVGIAFLQERQTLQSCSGIGSVQSHDLQLSVQGSKACCSSVRGLQGYEARDPRQ